MRGSCTRPRAISTRRRMPPDRFFTCASRHSRELDRLEQLVDQLLALRARHAVQLREDDQVLFDAQLEVARHRLRDDADRAAHAVGLLDDVEAVDERGARGRRQQRRQHADQRRLAGAVRAEQAEDLAFLDGEADAVDGGEVAELLDDAAGRRSRSWTLWPSIRDGSRTYAVMPTREPAIRVVDAQPDLERLDVALGAADVALRGERRVDAAVEHRALRARRRRAAGRSACRRAARDRCRSLRRRRGPRGRPG